MKSPNINQQLWQGSKSWKLEHSVSETSRTQGSRGKVGLVPLTQGSGYTVSKVMTEATLTRSQQRKDNERLSLSSLIPMQTACLPRSLPRTLLGVWVGDGSLASYPVLPC